MQIFLNSLGLFFLCLGFFGEDSSGMGSSRFFLVVVFIMVLCECFFTWTPPFSLLLSLFHPNRPVKKQKGDYLASR